MAYSDAQVAQAIAESVAQGFTVEQSVQGAIQNFGVPPDQAARAAGVQTSIGQTGTTTSTASVNQEKVKTLTPKPLHLSSVKQ